MVDRLGSCAENLQRWSKKIRTKFKENIDECRRQMEMLRDRRDEGGVAQYNNVKKRMVNLITQEEVFWQHRANVSWPKDGELNTRFFHVSATCRAKVNKIKKLQVNDNVIVDQGQIKEVARAYFQDIFMQCEGHYDRVVVIIEQCVGVHENELLVQPIGCEEFHVAL